MTYKAAFESINADRQKALWLLEKATGFSGTQLRLIDEGLELNPEAGRKFADMLEQSRRHVPIQYILGSWDFMGLPMKCRPGVLIPRADTEILAEEAVSFLQNFPGNPVVLDLCTGSGCVGISVAHFCPNARVNAVDIDPLALELSRENAVLNGVQDRMDFVRSNLFEEIEGHFHCITANPPYIPSGDIAGLAEEVKQEPVLALDGGSDGMEFYRTIVPECRGYLKPKGGLFLEVGADQGKAVAEMMKAHDFRGVMIIKDLEDRHRVVRGFL